MDKGHSLSQGLLALLAGVTLGLFAVDQDKRSGWLYSQPGLWTSDRSQTTHRSMKSRPFVCCALAPVSGQAMRRNKQGSTYLKLAAVCADSELQLPTYHCSVLEAQDTYSMIWIHGKGCISAVRGGASNVQRV